MHLICPISVCWWPDACLTENHARFTFSETTIHLVLITKKKQRNPSSLRHLLQMVRMCFGKETSSTNMSLWLCQERQTEGESESYVISKRVNLWLVLPKRMGAIASKTDKLSLNKNALQLDACRPLQWPPLSCLGVCASGSRGWCIWSTHPTPPIHHTPPPTHHTTPVDRQV